MSTIEEAELRELVSKAEFMVSQLKNSNQFCEKLTERVDNGDFNDTQHGMSLLEVKFHLLAMYNARLSIYMAMRARGDSVANHDLLNELATICWISDKLRNIQKQCQYSIDKLLDHAKNIKVLKTNNSNDSLSHKPDLSQLRPPTTTTTSATGAGAGGEDGNEYELNLPLSNEMNKIVNTDSDGIYRPPKLNPVLMDNPNNTNILSKQQNRQLLNFQKHFKGTDFYQSVRDDLTTLPKQEHFHLKNKEKKTDTDRDEYEESIFKRTAKSRNETKKRKRAERYKESSIGENLDAFLDSAGDNLYKAEKLTRFNAGGSFETTIGSITKKTLKGGKYIKGPWQKRRKILFKSSKQGQRVESRKKWRKSHPLKMNPAKALRMQGKRGRKARKSLGIKAPSRKIAKLKAKIGK